MASRAVTDCTPSLQAKIKKFTIAMFRARIPFVITCTARTVKEQVALWSQNRDDLFTVNALRFAAGLPPISEEENKHKVTWTLKSNHLIDLEDDIPGNDKSRAFDIAIVRDNKPVWDIKVDVNEDQIPDYIQAGLIGESVGLRWGGRFRHRDMPHLEDI